MKTEQRYRGARVTIMGLGLHGGGAATVRYLHSQGAELTVTDLRSPEELRPSIEALSGLPLRYVLGRHDSSDFRDADFVVKNPGVPRSSAYLQDARRIETDISLFLRVRTNPLLCVTGTKGKSTTATALHHVLLQSYSDAALGGNITVSPLAFIDTLPEAAPVVLELSSFQLGDLEFAGAIELLQPEVSVLTAIMPDHLNYYSDMDAYLHDKELLLTATPPEAWTVAACGTNYLERFVPKTTSRLCVAQAPSPRTSQPPTSQPPAGTFLRQAEAHCYLDKEHGYLQQGEQVPEMILHSSPLAGEHARSNLLAAGAAARLFGVSAALTAKALGSFPGVAHRMEYITEIRGVRYFNDSAATIAEAAVAAVKAFSVPVHLIAGGSDKQLSPAAFSEIGEAAAAVYLLAGSASDAIQQQLVAGHTPVYGPFETLRKALDAASQTAQPGDVVILSPGCASFGMFLNEFDRGNTFRAMVLETAAAYSSTLTQEIET
ncbi:MAG: UDP-N-acetylmuramoyl-L-alanine--D-glutamate ligase [Spirochaetaceae bacterium]|nr:MAG: UDP-N-acetylmuramoyl-L-alanine--D-glutamate ligase [Spirochaetaceae bacterium]